MIKCHVLDGFKTEDVFAETESHFSAPMSNMASRKHHTMVVDYV